MVCSGRRRCCLPPPPLLPRATLHIQELCCASPLLQVVIARDSIDSYFWVGALDSDRRVGTARRAGCTCRLPPPWPPAPRTCALPAPALQLNLLLTLLAWLPGCVHAFWVLLNHNPLRGGCCKTWRCTRRMVAPQAGPCMAGGASCTRAASACGGTPAPCSRAPALPFRLGVGGV